MVTWTTNLLASQDVRAILVALAVTLLTAVGARIFAARPRIQWGVPTNIHFLLPKNPQGLNEYARTQQFTVSNQGRKTAEDLEICLNWRPAHIEYYPHIPIKEETNKDGRYIMTLGRLNPKEFITFQMLAINQDLPKITYIRCAGYHAKRVNMAPQRIFPIWFNLSVVALMLIGLMAVIYMLALLVV